MYKTLQRAMLALTLVLFAHTAAQAQTINGLAAVCKNSTSSYSISIPQSGITYAWTMSPAIGNLSNLYGSSTTVLWPTPGVTNLTATGRNSVGSIVFTSTVPITVGALPQPIITSNYQVGCQRFIEPSDIPGEPGSLGGGTPLFNDDDECPKACEDSWVTYTATGTAGSSFTWVVSGGVAFPSGPNCLVHWGNVGLGSITVTEQTASPTNCTGTRTTCVDIIGKPHASFGAQPDTTLPSVTICENGNVQFVDHSYISSTSPIVNWYWDFGDGQTFGSSASTNPTHTYPIPGNYQVMLVVKNACNCRDTSYLNVDVAPGAGVEFECAGVACEYVDMVYSLKNGFTLPCGVFDWSVSGGTITSGQPYQSSVVINWDNIGNDGFGYVHFDPGSCGFPCSAITTLKVPVIQANGHIVGTKALCAQTQYKYTLPAWPGTFFQWNLTDPSKGTLTQGDQPNEIILTTNNVYGTVTLQATYDNPLAGCSGTADIQLEIFQPENILGDKKVCHTSSGTYQTQNGNPGDWTLIDPNNVTTTYSGVSSVTISFGDVGTYSLAVAGQFCSPAPFQIKVSKLPLPPDQLNGPDTVCADAPYEFTVGNAAPGSVFEWTATNGTIQGAKVGKRVTVIFSGTGAYSIQAVRTLADTPFCASIPLVKNLVRPVVTPNVTGKDTVCPNSVETYLAGYNSGESYKWRLNDPLLGSIDDNEAKNVTITWNNLAASTTTSIILDIIRCNQTYTQVFPVVIQGKTAYSLSLLDTNVCRNEVFPVTLVATPALSSATLLWSVPGAINPGPHSVPPAANLTTDYQLTEVATGNLVREIYVIVQNPNGCPFTDTVRKQLTLKPSPIALVTPFGPYTTCAGQVAIPPTTLTATLQSGSSSTAIFQWVRNTTIPAGTGSSIIVNNQLGNYMVIATGINGCSDNSNTVRFTDQDCPPVGGCTINPEPTFTISSTVDCGHLTVKATYPAAQFMGNIKFSGAAFSSNLVTNYGTPGSTVNPASMDMDISKAGSFYTEFQFAYLSTTGDSCYRTKGLNTIVPIVPGVLHELKCDNTTGYTLNILDNTTFYPSAIISARRYSVDGGTFATGGNSFSYGAISVGTHNITIRVVYTFNGVTDSCEATQPIVVLPKPVAAFTVVGPVVTACVDAQEVLFKNYSTNANSYLWRFGDFSSNTLAGFAPPINKTYSDPGSKLVQLIVDNGFGCSDAKDTSIQIVPNHLEGNLLISDSIICEGSTATLTYSATQFSTPPTFYQWMNDTKLFFSSLPPVNSINVGQSGSYWVHIGDQYGCWENIPQTDRKHLSIIAVPDAIITGDSLQCVGNTFTLNGYAGSDPALSYSWTRNGSSIGGNTPILVQTGLAAGTYTYVLTLTQTSGSRSCTKVSTPYKVKVNAPSPPPALNFSVNCNPYEVTLEAIPNNPGHTYTWSNGSTGNPIVTNDGGQYKVWHTDNNGCVSKGEAYTPKDPAGYLWIFPTGCYTYCPPLLIPSPSIPFAYWEHYEVAGPIQQNGFFSIPAPFSPNGSGDFGMMLDNGYCQASIETLRLDMNCGEGSKQRDPQGGDGTNNQNQGRIAQLGVATANPWLRAAPNPAKHLVQVAYRFGSNAQAANNRSLELYDMTGRKLASHQPESRAGTWQLSLEGYAAGIYQIVMKDNGQIVGKLRLSVQH